MTDAPAATPLEVDWTNGSAALLISRCRACEWRWYLQRRWCPRCGSVEIAREGVAGPGRIAAVTVVHRRTDGGKAIGIALVDLQEGVRVMVRCPSGTLVGQRVTVGIVDEAPEGAPSRILPAVLEAEGRGTDD